MEMIKEIKWRKIIVYILQLIINKVEGLNKKIAQKVRPAADRIYLEEDSGPGLYNPDGKSIKFQKW